MLLSLLAYLHLSCMTLMLGPCFITVSLHAVLRSDTLLSGCLCKQLLWVYALTTFSSAEAEMHAILFSTGIAVTVYIIMINTKPAVVVMMFICNNTLCNASVVLIILPSVQSSSAHPWTIRTLVIVHADSAPEPRRAAAGALFTIPNTASKQLLIHGGRLAAGHILGDLWQAHLGAGNITYQQLWPPHKYDLQKKKGKKPVGPAARKGHAAVAVQDPDPCLVSV